LRGERTPPLRASSATSALDPSLEVFPEPPRIAHPEPNDDPRRIAPE